jgi:thymidylate synthase (FAD)
MGIKQIRQYVEILPSIDEKTLLNMFEHVTATPYGNGLYDLPKTRNIIGSCVRRGHLSILEHGNITVKCTTNIGTYKDFTRHRHCAFTIESTSFCKYKGDWTVITTKEDLEQAELEALQALQQAYRGNENIKTGRDFLPQCSAATMVMTTNIQEYRHIISVRGDPNDNPLTRELRNLIWIELNNKYPFFFPITKNTVDNSMCIYNAFGPVGIPCSL